MSKRPLSFEIFTYGTLIQCSKTIPFVEGEGLNNFDGRVYFIFQVKERPKKSSLPLPAGTHSICHTVGRPQNTRSQLDTRTHSHNSPE